MQLRSAVFVAMLSSVAVVSADESLPFTCRAERAQLEVNIRQSEERIDSAWIAENPAQKCVAVRLHTEVMRNAIAVYTRCLSGSDRDASRAMALDRVADFEALADEMFCP
jgi:hypothetical protein